LPERSLGARRHGATKARLLEKLPRRLQWQLFPIVRNHRSLSSPLLLDRGLLPTDVQPSVSKQR